MCCNWLNFIWTQEQPKLLLLDKAQTSVYHKSNRRCSYSVKAITYITRTEDHHKSNRRYSIQECHSTKKNQILTSNASKALFTLTSSSCSFLSFSSSTIGTIFDLNFFHERSLLPSLYQVFVKIIVAYISEHATSLSVL